jgi:hypothetical protein
MEEWKSERLEGWEGFQPFIFLGLPLRIQPERLQVNS